MCVIKKEKTSPEGEMSKASPVYKYAGSCDKQFRLYMYFPLLLGQLVSHSLVLTLIGPLAGSLSHFPTQHFSTLHTTLPNYTTLQ